MMWTLAQNPLWLTILAAFVAVPAHAEQEIKPWSQEFHAGYIAGSLLETEAAVMGDRVLMSVRQDGRFPHAGGEFSEILFRDHIFTIMHSINANLYSLSVQMEQLEKFSKQSSENGEFSGWPRMLKFQVCQSDYRAKTLLEIRESRETEGWTEQGPTEEAIEKVFDAYEQYGNLFKIDCER